MAPQGTKVGARETDLLSWFCSTVDGRDYSTDNFDYLNWYHAKIKFLFSYVLMMMMVVFVNIWSNATSK